MRSSQARSPTRPFVLTVDIEPPDREPASDGNGCWTGFAETVELLEALRGQLRQRTGRTPRFAWFVRLDPQIEVTYGHLDWALRRYGDELRRMAAGATRWAFTCTPSAGPPPTNAGSSTTEIASG